MVKVFVNNEIVYVPLNSTVLEACESVGIEVPRFCFHERLSVAGNCRMCLVEIEKSPKPVASCAMPVVNEMRIFTNTPVVKKAREGVLEFLLLNHPLDCPVCDQGGECDLQDQAMVFGSDKSRAFDYKRGVENKNCGPLIKTIMTRCIHCTRCVRFATDIAGVEELGTSNRGCETEIGTYVGKVFQSELSGNVIDLCPVGALTSKAYSFLSRPWELRTAETIDLSDAVGSNTKVDFKETEIVRVLPRLNENLNEEWISDKSRFNFDALKKQRLDKPYMKKEGILKACSWQHGLSFLEKLLLETKPCQISIVCSPKLDSKTIEESKKLANSLGILSFGYPRQLKLNSDFSENFLNNTTLAEIEQSDFCLLVGANPRYEASMLNLKFRKRFRQGLFKAALVGIPHDLSYKTDFVGISPGTLVKITEGRHQLCKGLKEAEKPIILYSASLAEREDFSGLRKALTLIGKFTKVLSAKWNGLCFLNQESNQVGALNLGLKAIDFKKLKTKRLCLLVGSLKEGELIELEKRLLPQTKLVLFGTNGSDFVKNSELVLPTTTFLEKCGFYINLEGTSQKTQKATSGPALAREESQIFSLLKNKESFKKDVGCSSKAIAKEGFFFSKTAPLEKREVLFTISQTPFLPYTTDFYTSDSLSEKSSIMAKCSFTYRATFKNFV